MIVVICAIKLVFYLKNEKGVFCEKFQKTKKGVLLKSMEEKSISQAHIVDNWVVCPFCFKKQFPVDDGVVIANLKLRCKSSRADKEHFMVVNYYGKG